MVEFTVVMGLLMGTLLMLTIFLYTFREYGGRILNLVGMDYP